MLKTETIMPPVASGAINIVPFTIRMIRIIFCPLVVKIAGSIRIKWEIM